MGCCGDTGFNPKADIDELYARASDWGIYSHSGICAHLPEIKRLAESVPNARIVELGVGGGDQSACAWLAARPKNLTCYDINEPFMLTTLIRAAKDIGVDFEFQHGDILTGQPVENDILFIDSLHNKAQVEAELAMYVTPSTVRIAFHDVVSFGDYGQAGGDGINLAIARFMFKNPQWRVLIYHEYDNGFLVLARD